MLIKVAHAISFIGVCPSNLSVKFIILGTAQIGPVSSIIEFNLNMPRSRKKKDKYRGVPFINLYLNR